MDTIPHAALDVGVSGLKPLLSYLLGPRCKFRGRPQRVAPDIRQPQRNKAYVGVVASRAGKEIDEPLVCSRP